MMAFLRFAAWATVLALPAWMVSHVYQQALAAAAARALALVGQRVEVLEAAVAAPFDLAVFAALCLASRKAPAAPRRRALAIGLPIMMLLEVLTVALGIAVTLPFRSDPAALETALRVTGSLVETIPWVSAALVWLVLLGRWELRLGVPPHYRTHARGC